MRQAFTFMGLFYFAVELFSVDGPWSIASDGVDSLLYMIWLYEIAV